MIYGGSALASLAYATTHGITVVATIVIRSGKAAVVLLNKRTRTVLQSKRD